VLLVLTLTLPCAALDSNASTSAGGRLHLVAQSDDVVGSGTFAMTVGATASLKGDPLGIQVSVYPKLLNRTEFNSTLSTNSSITATCLTQTPVLPLPTGATPTAQSRSSIRLKVLEGAPSSGCTSSETTLSLTCSPAQCAGVYPVQVALIDTTTKKTVQTFVTHLIELDTPTVTDRLNVGMVLSLGSSLDLSPSGRSTLSAGQLVALATTLNTISSHKGVHLTIALYPQLLVALERTTPTPTTVIHQLETLLKRRAAHQTIELLDTPFASMNTSALAGAHQDATFAELLSLGTATWATFGLPARETSYLAPGELTSGGEAILSSSCLTSIVLQPSTPLSTTSGLTQTAPVGVPTTKHCPNTAIENSSTSAFVADSSVGALTSLSNSVVLAAHHFLAALAQIYFEQPNLAGRDVVVTPSESMSTRLLSEVLNELGTSPLLSNQTLGAMLATTPIGTNGNTTAIVLPASTRGSNGLPEKAIVAAAKAQRILTSLVPSNSALLTEARQDVEFGESTGLSPLARRHLIGAAESKITEIAKSLSFLGTSNFTLTSAAGKIPITIDQNGDNGPINVRILLQPSGLILPNGGSKSTTLKANATSLANVKVETRGSGISHLSVSVLTPIGGRVLISRLFTVRSTAISIPAVLLSLLAVAVLAAWWIRSFKRRRRDQRKSETVQ
jgi:hypothetical protein